MRAVIDTCVIVDALQSREPFCKDAQSIFLLCANRQFEGFLTAKAITDIYYLTHRQTHSDKATRDVLTKLCALFGLRSSDLKFQLCVRPGRVHRAADRNKRRSDGLTVRKCRRFWRHFAFYRSCSWLCPRFGCGIAI